MGDAPVLQVLDGRVGAGLDALPAADAHQFVDDGRGGLHLDLSLADEGKDPRRRRRALGHGIGDVLRALGTPGDEHSIRHRRHRVQFGVLLLEPTVGVGADAEEAGHFPAVVAWLQPDGQHHHIDRHPPLQTGQGVLELDDEPAFLLRPARGVGHLSDLSTDEVDPLVQHPVVELLVHFPRGADVDVEVVHLSAGLVVDQMGQFQGVHTADPRAVLPVVLVPAADAVDDGDPLGHRLPVPQDHLAAGGPGPAEHPFQFQAGEDVGEAAVAELGDAPGVEGVEAGGEDDVPYLHL